MPKKSAGILLFREGASGVEVLLAHPGGPFWARKDDGAWSIPKGEFEPGEDPLKAAKREFEEETGLKPACKHLMALKPVRQPGKKLVYAWATKSDPDLSGFKSNTFSMEWPPKSGKQQEFPEIDRLEWFGIDKATRKILKGQVPFLTQLKEKLGLAGGNG